MNYRDNITLLTLLVAVSASADPVQVSEIVGYEKWLPVTKRPVTVSQDLWSLCVRPPPQWTAMNAGPHKGGFISVRVNDLGRKLFLNEFTPQFPDGTVIIKEKLKTATDSKPDSLGIMIKRESKWEFAFIDAQGSVSRGKEQLENCYSCHASASATDGVFRSYLYRQNLK